jgi:hypothetical protein
MYTPFGLGTGLILIAVGAILVWGVSADAEGVNVDAIGWILMIVGLVSALLSLAFWDRWRGGASYARRGRVVEREVAPAPRTVERREVVEEDVAGPPPGAPPPPPP